MRAGLRRAFRANVNCRILGPVPLIQDSSLTNAAPHDSCGPAQTLSLRGAVGTAVLVIVSLLTLTPPASKVAGLTFGTLEAAG